MKQFFILLAVAAMAFSAMATELTVAEGDGEAQYAPFYGLYMDTRGTVCQVIYPADMLTDMQGGTITEIKFYPTAALKDFGDALLQVALKEVEQDRYTSTQIVEGATVVATDITPVAGNTEFVIEFTEPFVYNGGNLMIETTLTEAGKMQSTKFYGSAVSYAVGLAQYTYAWADTYYYETEHVLPMATFTYETAAPQYKCAAPEIGYQITESWQATVTITNYEPGATVRYFVYRDNELTLESEFTGDSYSFIVEGEGNYMVFSYAFMEDALQSETASTMFFLFGNPPQPTVDRGNVNGMGGVDMDDLTALINYLLDSAHYDINQANAAACNSLDNTTVDMDDLTALINFLLAGTWAD